MLSSGLEIQRPVKIVGKQMAKQTKNKVRLGDVVKVSNQNPKPAANKEYFFFRGQMAGNKEVPFLFTEAELIRAKDRAVKNPEDCIKPGWLRDLFD